MTRATDPRVIAVVLFAFRRVGSACRGRLGWRAGDAGRELPADLLVGRQG